MLNKNFQCIHVFLFRLHEIDEEIGDIPVSVTTGCLLLCDCLRHQYLHYVDERPKAAHHKFKAIRGHSR